MIYKLNGVYYDANSYLIVGKKNILIDPGTPGNFEFLKNQIEEIVKDIDLVINTHCHYDHAGSDYLFEEYFDAPTIIHDSEVEHLKNGDKVTVSWLFNATFNPPKEIIPISEVKDELNKVGIEVIYTPGHTKGSISLVVEDKMITGDTLFAYGVGRWDLPTGDLAELRASIEKLERIAYQKGIAQIYPGHGEVGDLGAFGRAKMFI
ncbi:MBL fold metallo-hydrolase [Methanotorris igneus]|uniref:Beta-lactamase domain protein n=1 Tax=Methanotorris igneus (strain DSM 5666 / JCM 11834 / Kol 5) TaxID=880724 RepID=F6BDJ0_METIK|nr:MBL fold metallo-hydrolase [Methanotorris igneus]AEF96551.1 beta-lactamase domain protein [Methanotorris igneus Kol 5]